MRFSNIFFKSFHGFLNCLTKFHSSKITKLVQTILGSTMVQWPSYVFQRTGNFGDWLFGSAGLLSSCTELLWRLCQGKLSLMSPAAAVNVSLSSAKVLGYPHQSFCMFAAAQVIMFSVPLQRDIFQTFLLDFLCLSCILMREKSIRLCFKVIS